MHGTSFLVVDCLVLSKLFKLKSSLENFPLVIQSTSHSSDHTGLADFVRITENPDYVETFSVLHFTRKLLGLSNSVRNIQESG